MRMTLRARSLDVLLRAASLLERPAHGLRYFAAGMLGSRDWRVMTERVWRTFHHREEQVLSGLMDWEKDLFEQFIPRHSKVLLVGSGSGRDLIGLVRMGHQVVGLEPCGPPIETARRVLELLQLSADLQQGFIQDLNLPDRFDAIVFSYYCYAYIPGSAQRVIALDTAARHLAPGGRILLSHPYSTRRSGGLALTKLGAFLTRSDWRPEPYDVLSFPADRDGSRVVCLEHYFSAEEIVHEAARAGLRVTHQRGAPDPVAVLER